MQKVDKLSINIDFDTSFQKYFCIWLRITYSSNHALLRLLGKWKSALGSKKFNGAVQIDLSKVYDCIPKDLLMAK